MDPDGNVAMKVNAEEPMELKHADSNNSIPPPPPPMPPVATVESDEIPDTDAESLNLKNSVTEQLTPQDGESKPVPEKEEGNTFFVLNRTALLMTCRLINSFGGVWYVC